MNLSPLSVPYRTLYRAGSVSVLVVFGYGAATATIGPVLAGLLGAAAVLAAVGYEVAYYHRFTYAVTDDTLDVRSGVISRREREIPYRRIQNVDVSQSVIQRALGIAAVGFETAGGSSTEASLRFVTIDEARRLQRTVQERKRELASAGPTGIPTDAGPDTDRPGRGKGSVAESPATTAVGGEGAPDGTAELLFEIAPHELALKGALSFDVRVFGVVTFVLGSGSVSIVGLVAESPLAPVALATVAVIGIALVSWIVGIVVSVVNYYGFRLTRVGDDLRYERGLLRRYSGSIPLSKLQTLSVGDNPLMRAAGYASLSIETAGYSPGSRGAPGSQAAVPIAGRERVLALANEIDAHGTPDFAGPPPRVRWRYGVRYTMVVGLVTALLFGVNAVLDRVVPWYLGAALVPLVPVAAHYRWKHRRYWIGPDHFVTRNGFWRRTTTAVPYYRIQTVIDSRSLLQRRWSIATVIADTAGSLSLIGHDAAAVDVDVDDARDCRRELGQRLQRALADRRDDSSTGREPG